VKIHKGTRIYVAGCGGMLGQAVHSLFSSVAEVRATDIDLNEPWLSHADVRDFESVARSVRDFRPDAILNLAALTDLEYCERNIEDSWLTNALGAENVGLLANSISRTRSATTRNRSTRASSGSFARSESTSSRERDG
jgi:dTDP-4-dehydrorhamnose reductase